MKQSDKACALCAKEMPWWADSCPYCGQAVAREAAGAPPEFWEYCEIEQRSETGADCVAGWYEASAVGRRGKFQAARSGGFVAFLGVPADEVKGDADRDYQQLVSELLSQGWQPMPEPGGAGWFRRKAAGPG